jgi:hypothetical protein
MGNRDIERGVTNMGKRNNKKNLKNVPNAQNLHKNSKFFRSRRTQDTSEILSSNFLILRKVTQVFDFELAAELPMVTANDDCK